MPHGDKKKVNPIKGNELIGKFGNTNGYKILYPSEGHIMSVSCIVGLPNPNSSDLVTLYDGEIPILVIDLKNFIKTINDKRQIDINMGITYKQPQKKDAVEFHYDFFNSLVATGNVENLVFWIERPAIGKSI